jgi:hypothetical protein
LYLMTKLNLSIKSCRLLSVFLWTVDIVLSGMWSVQSVNCLGGVNYMSK